MKKIVAYPRGSDCLRDSPTPFPHQSALSLLLGGGRINWPTSLRKVGAQIHTTSSAPRYDQDDASERCGGPKKPKIIFGGNLEK